ncbi:hypothetical protein [uncultured Flavobacterium sp.]|uniref:hypothetical protein n=1 Tax=uncultured Flavobacterium sp. TaxID=165435 RepID=UPI0030CA423D|tara:strand:+ start:496 stop:996 length:501 start_codon:yes stop_codon:yes gene_type:complete
MKKIITVLVCVFTLISCGSDKKKEGQEPQEDIYSIEINAIYEKDDSIAVFYQTDNYMQYDKPLSQLIKGSPMPQKLVIYVPQGIVAENFIVVASTNKNQPHITVTNITVNIGDLTIDGSNYKYSDLFLTDASFSWDLEKARYNLTHTNKYPPAFVGNEKLLSLVLQ